MEAHMSEGFLIYLLSIAENFGNVLDSLSWWMAALAFVTYVITLLRYWAMIVEEHGGYSSGPVTNQEEIQRQEGLFAVYEPKVRRFSITMLVFAILLRLGSGLFPSTENVLKAYALIEGSKVINAPNAEAAATAIGKRFDKFLDIVDKGINGRSTPPTPAPTAEPKAPVK
jgi:hypothetical protein